MSQGREPRPACLASAKLPFQWLEISDFRAVGTQIDSILFNVSCPPVGIVFLMPFWRVNRKARNLTGEFRLRANALFAPTLFFVRNIRESWRNESVAIRHLNFRQRLRVQHVIFFDDVALGQDERG